MLRVRALAVIGALIVSVAASALAGSGVRREDDPVIVVSTDRSLVTLAGREVQRYLWLRTGAWAVIDGAIAEHRPAIVLESDVSLGEQGFRLRTSDSGGQRILRIAGGSDLATLYGVYRFAETLGVRFHVHGDTVPDGMIPLELPVLDETHRPAFGIRGIQPFHDFYEGPDWWEAGDYKAYFAQLVKMRMNFAGFHCYPEGGVGPEPLVWIGLPDEIDGAGRVKASYPARWAGFGTGGWRSAIASPEVLCAGGALLFADGFTAPSVMVGQEPLPTAPEACNEVFERAGDLLADSFAYGRRMGVKICVGTETPLAVPKAVQERLRARGLDPADPQVVSRLYEGMFARLQKRFPVDYYWLWTPEDWTWRGNSAAELQAVIDDLRAGDAALARLGNPFPLGTCGWVLGPQSDRGALDRVLPASSPMACINRQVGFESVETAFVRVRGRETWAIPWMEDDPAMTVPQLWAGRTRRDAADAHALGCTGLLGIHWRTRVIAPSLDVLAQAGWEQHPWNPEFGRRLTPGDVAVAEGHQGGRTATAPAGQLIEGTPNQAVLRDCLWAMSEYRAAVPNGTYTVTLQFCEIAYDAPGRRVFDVAVQGKPVVEGLDLFARVGKFHAYELCVPGVVVADGSLRLTFRAGTDFSLLSGLVVEGTTVGEGQAAGSPFTRRINCGGGEVEGYEADIPDEGQALAARHPTRDLPCLDFYEEWCRAEFGPERGAKLARLFARLDGGPGRYTQKSTSLPRPATWIGGPGEVWANRVPWGEEASRYGFVDEMEAMRPAIRGPGAVERFDYWRSTFRSLRAMGRVGCVRGTLDGAMERLKGETDPARRRELAAREALPARVELARAWEEMITEVLGTISTPGELGTLANLELRTRLSSRFVDGHDAEIRTALGAELPPETALSAKYSGPPRLIVPGARGTVLAGERASVRALVLAGDGSASVELRWRALGGEKEERAVGMRRLGRGVYECELPALGERTLEYRVHATLPDGGQLHWPASAPARGMTLVVVPGL